MAEPPTLLLKVAQSVAVNWPLLTTLALGRFMTKALMVVVMLKLLPVVPVETLAIMLLTIRELLADKFLLASVVTRELAERVAILTLPRAVTWKKLAPDVEATAKIGRVWEELEAATNRVPPDGVEELIIKDLVVLSQRKLAVPVVVVAAL